MSSWRPEPRAPQSAPADVCPTHTTYSSVTYVSVRHTYVLVSNVSPPTTRLCVVCPTVIRRKPVDHSKVENLPHSNAVNKFQWWLFSSCNGCSLLLTPAEWHESWTGGHSNVWKFAKIPKVHGCEQGFYCSGDIVVYFNVSLPLYLKHVAIISPQILFLYAQSDIIWSVISMFINKL